jgi:hypothetical protein
MFSSLSQALTLTFFWYKRHELAPGATLSPFRGHKEHEPAKLQFAAPDSKKILVRELMQPLVVAVKVVALP